MTSGNRQIDVEEARRLVAAERARMESSLASLDWGGRGAASRFRQPSHRSDPGAGAAADRSATADHGARSGRLEADLAARHINLGGSGRPVTGGGAPPPEQPEPAWGEDAAV